MKFELQIIFIFTSILTFIFILHKIRKHKLNIDDAVIWIIWAFILLIFSIFVKIPYKLSKILGFDSTSNFIMSLFVFFAYIISFYQTIKISQLREKNKDLVHKISLRDKK